MTKVPLIENWKQCWKLLSVQLAALLGLLDVAYEYLPALQSYLPEGWVRWAALAIIVGRIVKVKVKYEPDDGKG
ncbi:putative membrane protein [Pseudomonas phage PaMx11]|uniref:Membrane protein n=1 Tax=Pseudomonas phage PaMx11 TaxID=1175657 RepID=A0A0S0N8I5_BPPAM|nr:holin [Pseudomonas phage PaMx11]ALH23710.1 putative membrane protein [Pseudomonas phage PaMx11]